MTDISPGEEKLQKLDKRDMITRSFGLFILSVAVAFNIFSAYQLQNLIKVNRQETLKARQANFERQDQTQAYIKCILLLRYDTGVTSTSSRQEVETALDTCAKQ